MDYHRRSIVSVVLLVCALLLAAPSVACAGGPPPIVGGILLGGLVVATAFVAMLWGAIIGAFRSTKATRAKHPELKGKQYAGRWALSFIAQSSLVAFRSFMILLALWVGLLAGAFVCYVWIGVCKVCKQ